MCLGQFLVIKVTAGQQIEFPNLRMERLAWRDLREFLIRIGVSKMRLILRLVLV